MQKLKYHITTISPVLLVSNTGDTNMVATREYIPGSAVLGLFAGEFIRNKTLSNAHKDNTFLQWFLNDGLRFTNAYIISTDKDNKLWNNLPVPISLQKEKKDEKKIHDLLIDGSFKEQTKGLSGFGRIEGDRFYKQTVRKLLNFHHERDYEKGTTKKGVIFNYESIDSGQTFDGEIIGKGEALKEFLKLFSKENVFSIGRSRGAQYGKIRFEFISEQPEEITTRVDSINGDISITLVSDAIIYNKEGFSTTDVIELETELKKTLGDSIQIDKAFIKTGEVENFVSVWKLRRPSETCFQMGSCFFIKGLLFGDKDKLLELEKNGIGERRGDGFGRVVFGLQKEPKFDLQDNTKPIKGKPPLPLPKITKRIAHIIVRDFIYQQVEISALNDLQGFKKPLPTKSLIGRLETLLRQKKNKNALIALRDGLRKKAEDQLQNCQYGSERLFDFLKREIDVKNIIKESIKLKELCTEVGFEFEEGSVFASEVYCVYFLTFFSQMRKRIK